MYFLYSLYSVTLFILCILSFYIPKVINKTFKPIFLLYFLSPILCVHLDRVCALLSDPNKFDLLDIFELLFTQ